MAVWCHKLTVQELIEAVPCDVNFTHVHKNIEHMIISYCLAIRHLLNNAKSADKSSQAFCAAYDYLKSVDNIEVQSYLELAKIFAESGDPKVFAEHSFNPKINMCLAMYGFILSFTFILWPKVKDKDLYDYAMALTVGMGGDTDTNCCIVGGMIGAKIGLKNIDSSKI
eukprot:CAMPEP_0116878964 /NCGR_PEP_ID=MMETSP0463-20121206/10718_1 /TAXON_ID=181622 /ORGANISM="Strombidinopsis sp, Strain SopsisLIS2011" /LENGTH=167 /DNA_ID=CAMNT_0004527719 /DNA_START=446 /DNA_END=949 /DNA_ORIENTATION=-